MRIIAGRYRGRKIKAPKGSVTRPVLARVREALFNILGDQENLSFLDLFSGTGAIGIEALSRGADSVIFVEIGAVQCRLIRDNIPETDAGIDIVHSDALRTLRRFIRDRRTFDIIFADPPYERGLSQKTVDRVCSGGILSENGVFAVTVRSSENLPEECGDCVRIDDRIYGDTRLAFYAYKRRDG